MLFLSSLYHLGITFEDVRLERTRLEIFHDGEWGTVRDHNWDLNDASVVCTMLGLGDAVDAITNGAEFPGTDGPVWIENIDCNGGERTLLDCVYKRALDDNDHNSDVGVRCSEG